MFSAELKKLEKTYGTVPTLALLICVCLALFAWVSQVFQVQAVLLQQRLYFCDGGGLLSLYIALERGKEITRNVHQRVEAPVGERLPRLRGAGSRSGRAVWPCVCPRWVARTVKARRGETSHGSCPVLSCLFEISPIESALVLRGWAAVSVCTAKDCGVVANHRNFTFQDTNYNKSNVADSSAIYLTVNGFRNDGTRPRFTAHTFHPARMVTPLLGAFNLKLPTASPTAPSLAPTALGVMQLLLTPLALDMLLTFNFGVFMLVLLLAMSMSSFKNFVAFPSILQMTTLLLLLMTAPLRLSHNMASFRVVLMNGHTGTAAARHVIESFPKLLAKAATRWVWWCY